MPEHQVARGPHDDVDRGNDRQGGDRHGLHGGQCWGLEILVNGKDDVVRCEGIEHDRKGHDQALGSPEHELWAAVRPDGARPRGGLGGVHQRLQTPDGHVCAEDTVDRNSVVRQRGHVLATRDANPDGEHAQNHRERQQRVFGLFEILLALKEIEVGW